MNEKRYSKEELQLFFGKYSLYAKKFESFGVKKTNFTSKYKNSYFNNYLFLTRITKNYHNIHMRKDI